jgi:hypothetical protein
MCRLVRLAYQPPTSGTLFSEQTSHQQPTSNIFLSEKISTSHQSNEQAEQYDTRDLLSYFQHCRNDKENIYMHHPFMDIY